MSERVAGVGRDGGRFGLMRAAAAMTTAGVLGLLAGCTGSEPAPTPSSTVVTPSPTASPTRTPLPFPTPAAAISEPTPEGAIAAGTQFIALYDYAFSTGDAEPFAAMSGPECEYCGKVVDRVRQMREGGYSTEGDPLRVVASESTEIREDEWFRVQLRAEQGPIVTVAPDGEREQTSDGGTVDYVFAMSWVGDAWRVDAVSIELVEQ